ncbi:MAG: CBS domain-containing protein, partial [Nitrospirae bacterium]
MVTARDIMQTEVVTCTPETPLAELARQMLDRGVSGVPVVDTGGRVVGVVTENDIIESHQELRFPTVVALFDAILYVESPRHFEERVRKAAATTAGELMHAPPITVGPEATLEEIATVMTRHGVHHLPVVEGGRLVGIVGKADVVRG